MIGKCLLDSELKKKKKHRLYPPFQRVCSDTKIDSTGFNEREKERMQRREKREEDDGKIL